MSFSDPLHLLIKSLNKNEIIYFKRYAKKQTNNYLKLFDAVAKQKQEYDEERILKKFAKEKFSKQLHVTKNRLLHSILKSLQDYHYNISFQSGLKNTLRSVEILFNKGLYDTCSKLLSKAKKDIHVYEDETDSLFLEIIEWERKLLIKQIKDKSKIQRALIDLEIQEEEVFNKYINARKYRFLVDKIFLINYTKGVDIDKKSQKLMDQYAKDPLLGSEKNALSFIAKIYYNNFFEIYYSLKKDTLSGIKYAKRKVELIEDHPEILRIRPSVYLDALDNLRILYTRHKNYREVFSVLNKIKLFPEKTIHIKVWKFVHSTIPEISTHSSIGEFQKASVLALGINKEIKDYEGQIDSGRLMFIYILMAYTFFGSANYKVALKWTNKILNEPNIGWREDLMNYAKLLNLILHFEIGNHDLLESVIKSSVRFFENKKSSYHFELSFIELLKEMREQNGEVRFITSMKNLKEAMIKNSSKGSISISQDNLELLLGWLESKIENKPFAEAIKEKQELEQH